MKNGSSVVGIGCFAASATLRRMFRKALENFVLTNSEDIFPAAQRILNDEDVTRFFRSAIRLGTKRPDQLDRALEIVSASAKITGFYLGLNKKSLHLIVFFKDAGHQHTKFITRLEKFNRLRNKHLH